jgi:hypothetical protein
MKQLTLLLALFLFGGCYTQMKPFPKVHVISSVHYYETYWWYHYPRYVHYPKYYHHHRKTYSPAKVYKKRTWDRRQPVTRHVKRVHVRQAQKPKSHDNTSRNSNKTRTANRKK